jgi:type IV secretion system protein VirD4
LEDIYGKVSASVIADLCDFKIVLKATDTETQEYFSKLVGTYDEIKTSTTVNRHAFWGYTTGSSTSTSTADRRAIKPEEFAVIEEPVLLHAIPNALLKTFFFVQKQPYYEEKGE